mmetsp:Transcript_22053/g.61060  ORF Transcript_22053/g.61060 Transcript_22053/m.61060 type:complete len:402 (-) Transcript_22053:2399-3604(-)
MHPQEMMETVASTHSHEALSPSLHPHRMHSTSTPHTMASSSAQSSFLLGTWPAMNVATFARCLSSKDAMAACTISGGTDACKLCSCAARRRPTSPAMRRVPRPSTATATATTLGRCTLPCPSSRTSRASSSRTSRSCCTTASTASPVSGNALSQMAMAVALSVASLWNSMILPNALAALSVASSLSSSLALGALMIAVMRCSASGSTCRKASGALAARMPRPYTEHCLNSECSEPQPAISTGSTWGMYLVRPAGLCSSRSSTTQMAMRRSSDPRSSFSRAPIWGMSSSTNGNTESLNFLRKDPIALPTWSNSSSSASFSSFNTSSSSWSKSSVACRFKRSVLLCSASLRMRPKRVKADATCSWLNMVGSTSSTISHMLSIMVPWTSASGSLPRASIIAGHT